MALLLALIVFLPLVLVGVAVVVWLFGSHDRDNTGAFADALPGKPRVHPEAATEPKIFNIAEDMGEMPLPTQTLDPRYLAGENTDSEMDYLEPISTAAK
jgi:hypothetical protein